MNKMLTTIAATTTVFLLSTGTSAANEVDEKQDLLAGLAADIASEVAAVTLATLDSAKVSLQQGIIGWYEEAMQAEQNTAVAASKKAGKDEQNQGE